MSSTRLWESDENRDTVREGSLPLATHQHADRTALAVAVAQRLGHASATRKLADKRDRAEQDHETPDLAGIQETEIRRETG